MSCGNPVDAALMVLGAAVSLLNGAEVPISVVIFAKVGNELVSYGIATRQKGSAEAGYYCGDNSAVFKYLTSNEPDSLLQQEVLHYSYYLMLVFVLAAMQALGSMLWTITSLRQTKRMRQTLLSTVIHQDVEWFDLNSATEIPTKLSE